MKFIRSRIHFLGITFFAPLSAVMPTSTWIAESPENNMQTPANWSPSGFPLGARQVLFDSSIENVDLNPTLSDDFFSVCSINFPNVAALFTIYFNNNEVALNGLGITGPETNARINATNTSNSTALGNQFSFNQSNSSSSGSAVLNIVNTGSLTSSSSGVDLSLLDGQFYVQGPFNILNGGSLTLSNTGSDTSSGSGANRTSFMNNYQAQISNTCIVEDDVSISMLST